jgi:hypothetical protein
MKTFLLGAVFALLATTAATTVVQASATDDKKWIAQCLEDNKDAKATPQVVQAYCTCMNGEMPDAEESTITQWEKTHPKEQAYCEEIAGWKK